MRQLLDAEVVIDGEDDEGETALHRCAVDGNESCIKLLLSRGANVNHVSEQSGTTALMCAAYGENAACVQLLLEHRADKSLRDSGGKTALDIAEVGAHVASDWTAAREVKERHERCTACAKLLRDWPG